MIFDSGDTKIHCISQQGVRAANHWSSGISCSDVRAALSQRWYLDPLFATEDFVLGEDLFPSTLTTAGRFRQWPVHVRTALVSSEHCCPMKFAPIPPSLMRLNRR